MNQVNNVQVAERNWPNLEDLNSFSVTATEDSGMVYPVSEKHCNTRAENESRDWLYPLVARVLGMAAVGTKL